MVFRKITALLIAFVAALLIAGFFAVNAAVTSPRGGFEWGPPIFTNAAAPSAVAPSRSELDNYCAICNDGLCANDYGPHGTHHGDAA